MTDFLFFYLLFLEELYTLEDQMIPSHKALIDFNLFLFKGTCLYGPVYLMTYHTHFLNLNNNTIEI